MPETKTQEEKPEPGPPTDEQAHDLLQQTLDAAENGQPPSEELRGAVSMLSEDVQTAIAAALSWRALDLLPKVLGAFDGDAERHAELAIILRALAAHSQAETIAELAATPDLSELFEGQGVEGQGVEDEGYAEPGDEWEGGGDAY
jgi:hypothetical protein